MADEQARLVGYGRIYLVVSVTDAVYGALTFYMGGSTFIADNTNNGPVVSAVISSWGSMRQFLDGEDGRERDSDALIDFSGNEVIVPSNGTKKWRFIDLLTEVNFRDSLVEFFQWNQFSPIQERIWAGYWDTIKSAKYDNGYPIVTVRIKPKLRSVENTVADVITSTLFSDAPSESIGKMPTRAYGDGRLRLVGGNLFTEPFIMGYPYPGVPGSVTQRVAIGANAGLRVRFAKGDGTSVAAEFKEGTNDSFTAESSVFVFDPSSGGMCMLNPSSVSIVNDTAKQESDLLYFSSGYESIRPSDVLANNQFANTFKLVDDDPSNFETSTDSIYQLDMQAPLLGGLIGTVQLAHLAIDAENTVGANRSYQLIFFRSDTGATIHGFSGTIGASAARQLYITPAANALNPNDIATVSPSAVSDFSSGRLITRDGASLEWPIGLRFILNGGSGNRAGVKVYGFSLVFKLNISILIPKFNNPFLSYKPNSQLSRPGDYNPSVSNFFAVGAWQKDDGSGTYTGSANSTIVRLVDIIYHLLSKVSGQTVNTTATTLGNVPDSRSTITGLGEYTDLLMGFGDDPVTLRQAISRIESEFPVFISKESDGYHIIPDVMAPHSSCFYRSSSEVIDIEPNDILDGEIEVWEDPPDEIENKVTVQYGRAFGSGRPQGSVEKRNEASILYFGQKDRPDPILAPSCVQQLIGANAVPASASALAAYAAFRKGWPRLNAIVGLSQKFYDIRRGNIVRFSTKMDGIGFPCPAYRRGRLIYAYYRGDTSVANQADDTTPTFVPSGSITSETYFCANYPYPSLTVAIPGGGAYTTVASGWEYWNGSSWQPFSGVTRSDGGDPLAVFKASAGTYTVKWTLPDPWDWKKSEIVISGATVGPGYWSRMKYNTSTVAVNGTALTRILDTWGYRLYRVIEATRRPGAIDEYPSMEVVLKEVM